MDASKKIHRIKVFRMLSFTLLALNIVPNTFGLRESYNYEERCYQRYVTKQLEEALE